MAVNTTNFPARGASSISAAARKAAVQKAAARHPSDDEILGLVTAVPSPAAGENYSGDAKKCGSSRFPKWNCAGATSEYSIVSGREFACR